MRCPDCHAEAGQGDTYCRHCGADLVGTSMSLVPAQRGLPALLSNSSLPRRVAAGVGAVALGVGIELLRRNMVARIFPSRSLPRVSPTGFDLKDVVSSRPDKAVKLPKGYEIHETVVYMTRIVRRQQ
jgi:hypothetical protein